MLYHPELTTEACLSEEDYLRSCNKNACTICKLCCRLSTKLTSTNVYIWRSCVSYSLIDVSIIISVTFSQKPKADTPPPPSPHPQPTMTSSNILQITMNSAVIFYIHFGIKVTDVYIPSQVIDQRHIYLTNRGNLTHLRWMSTRR